MPSGPEPKRSTSKTHQTQFESNQTAMTRLRIYTLYERVWHWFQAVCILALIFTGFHIHYPDGLRLLSFSTAVYVHNTLGWILVLNAFLGFFYYLTTGTIRQLIPEPREFHLLAWRQLRYYVYDIFRGDLTPWNARPRAGSILCNKPRT